MVALGCTIARAELHLARIFNSGYYVFFSSFQIGKVEMSSAIGTLPLFFEREMLLSGRKLKFLATTFSVSQLI